MKFLTRKKNKISEISLKRDGNFFHVKVTSRRYLRVGDTQRPMLEQKCDHSDVIHSSAARRPTHLGDLMDRMGRMVRSNVTAFKQSREDPEAVVAKAMDGLQADLRTVCPILNDDVFAFLTTRGVPPCLPTGLSTDH